MDPNTLNYIQAAMLLISSVTLFITWKLNKSIDGTKSWAVGGAIMTFSFVILALYTAAFKYTILPVTAASIGWLGYFYYYKGLCELLQTKQISFSVSAVIFTALISAMIYGDFFGENPKLWRVVVGSVGVAFISFLSFYCLMKVRIAFSLIRLFMLFTFGSMGAVWSVRIVYSFLDPPSGIEAFRFIDSFTFYMNILFTVSLTIGMIIMTAEKLQQQLREQAATDALTGLMNRRAFYFASEVLLKKALREKSNIIVCMVDLDYFKNINDTFGHLAGDMLLKKFAETARKCLRDNDLIARFGGEEFIILQTDITAEQSLISIQRLQKMFSADFVEFKGQRVQTTLSAGIADWKETVPDIDKTVNNADTALYNAKKNGRNRVEIYS